MNHDDSYTYKVEFEDDKRKEERERKGEQAKRVLYSMYHVHYSGSMTTSNLEGLTLTYFSYDVQDTW